MNSTTKAQRTPSNITLIGIPYDGNSSWMTGTAEAPPLIREALRCEANNTWSEAGIDIESAGVKDAGDLEITSASDFTGKIESAITNILEDNGIPLSLGGDHSITYPILRAVHARYPDVSILHFDAHPDIYQDFQGNPLSHASPFARISEEGLTGQLVQVGIRTMNAHQREQIQRYGVRSIEMKNWRDDLKFSFDTPVYLSFDMDVLDPAFAPGVSHREPGGLSTRDVIRIIQQLEGRIIGADLVEYNPRRDVDGITAIVCAKILKEMIGKILE